MHKRKILTWVLTFLLPLSAATAWFAVWRAITVPNASTWLVPMVWLSIFAVLISLASMIFVDTLLLELVLAGSLVTSIFFAPELWQLAAVGLGSYFLFLAVRRIRIDMDLNVVLSPWKSLQTGKSYLLLALAIMICAQYFLTVRKMDGQVAMPKFDLKPITKKIVMPMLATFNPQYKLINDETLTVDQFILQTAENSLNDQEQSLDENLLESQLPANLTPQEKEMVKRQAQDNFAKSQIQLSQKSKELTLQMGRKQFSDLVGQPVVGNEKISEIFAGLVEKKMNDFFATSMEAEKGVPLLPVIFTLILLLTIYPLGSMLSVLWFLLAKLVFFVLLKTETLTVKKIPVQKEILE